MRPFAAAVAAALLPASLAYAGPAASATPQDSGLAQVSQTVSVTLKPAWRVKRVKQLRISDGAARCRVTSLVRNQSKVAVRARLACRASQPRSVRVTVSVKGRKGATVSKRITFRVSPSPVPTPPAPTPPTPPAPRSPISLGSLVQVNTNAAGQGGNAEAASETWSPDGTKVAFISGATNLVPGVNDGLSHVYLKTLSTGAIRVVDTTAGGALANERSLVNSGLSFSPDGNWLAFCSGGSNLVSGTPLLDQDLYAKNLTTGEVRWYGPGCQWPTFSPDGSKIAFASEFENCGWNNNGNSDILVVEFNGPRFDCNDWLRVSTDSSGAQPPAPGPMGSTRPVWSPDSTRIAFVSQVPTLVPNDTNVSADIFVKNLNTGVTTRVSTASNGAQAQGESDGPAWSPDGTRIAFQSSANTLSPNDTNVDRDIFVKDLQSGQVTLVSTNASGVNSLFAHSRPSWAPDGTRLTWYSAAVDLLPIPDTNQRTDVYSKELASGFVQLVSATPAGTQGDGGSETFSSAPRNWSPDGTRVVFGSTAQNFSSTDGNAFNRDIFVKTVG